MALFSDRLHAGQVLADALSTSHGMPVMGASHLVLGLPRGGVPVAYEVAHALRAPLDVLVVRKLGVPGHEELAMGAVAGGGGVVLNHDVLDSLRVPPAAVDEVVERELAEVRRRERAYRGDREPLDLSGRSVLLVDDGIATGATVLAAVKAARSAGAASVIVAAPVGAPDSVARLERSADAVVCPHQPRGFGSVGEWYGSFVQTTDEEVRALLAEGAR